VYFDAEDDGELRCEESILCYGLENCSSWNFRGEGETVSDGRCAIISIPYIDCKKVRPSDRPGAKTDKASPLTLDAATTLLQSANVTFYCTLPLELTTDKIRLLVKEADD
jgi:hypothetical protein